jgi:hypothetical protein
MVKVWKYYCSVSIKSLVIELIAVPFIYNWAYKGKSSTYYDWMLRDFFQYMVNMKNSYAVIPGIIEICWFGSSWESKAQSAYERAQKACGYESGNTETDNILANLEWQKIFGDFFKG